VLASSPMADHIEDDGPTVFAFSAKIGLQKLQGRSQDGQAGQAHLPAAIFKPLQQLVILGTWISFIHPCPHGIHGQSSYALPEPASSASKVLCRSARTQLTVPAARPIGSK
jgi:hypothetical protein